MILDMLFFASLLLISAWTTKQAVALSQHARLAKAQDSESESSDEDEKPTEEHYTIMVKQSCNAVNPRFQAWVSNLGPYLVVMLLVGFEV